MSLLFTPGKIGTLEIPNRLIRSATAERMADEAGYPRQQYYDLYRELAAGGVGLIITGHMYVHPSGKCHPEMTGIYSDNQVPGLAKLAQVIHAEGGKVVAQINHGGMQCAKEAVEGTMAPSAINDEFLEQPAREMTPDEIDMLIAAYAQAARRVKEAGFDGVQLHGAHGYLINQFISPYVNHRTDEWGGDIEGRTHFLRDVTRTVREQVGNAFPVLIKFGMQDGVEGGLTADASAQVIALMKEMGLDGIEISGGLRAPNAKKGIRHPEDEAYFRPLAQKARPNTNLPLALVGGMRTRGVMEAVLASGDADIISMCRPLISEPHFPQLLLDGIKDKSRCISSNNCWAENPGVGIGCKCPLDKLEER
jgi:2,4-dienoyl-CoA reductase-like NADH-dependent reductase (Old Yellow Enzyme family)